MGPQDTCVVKMEHLVTRPRVRGELAPSHSDSLASGFPARPGVASTLFIATALATAAAALASAQPTLAEARA